MTTAIRIANCSGFYGDRLSAAREQVQGGPIDVLTGDWLAELTMLLLARDQLKDPKSGYARTFLPQIEPILATCLSRNIRIVTNAGGLNPHGLADAVRALAAKLGLSPRVAVVDGDDLREQVAAWQQADQPLAHADTGRPLTPKHGVVLTANAYLGSWGIAEALRRDADIVITGRVTDAAVVVGPAAWHHRWRRDDWDQLAGAVAAGHIIECGCQATGGNYAFYEEIADMTNLGFPIAEIHADGSSVITKHPGTGGAVRVGTVTAQLLYEIARPQYLTPDVTAHFETIHLTEEGPDRVRVSGVQGSPPPTTLKAGLALAAGYRNSMTAVIGGGDAVRKAALLEASFWPAAGGLDRYQEARTDLVRADRADPITQNESLSYLTFSVRDRDERKVSRGFTAPAVELALASIPGLTWTHPPRPATPIGVFWPTIIARDTVKTRLHLDGEVLEIAWPPTPTHESGLPLHEDFDDTTMPLEAPDTGVVREITLGEIVGARSGDKGGHANVGFWVRQPDHYPWLLDTLTEDKLAKWLAPSGYTGRIVRYELPNLLALNFVIEGWLGEGVAASLQLDPQAKCLAEWLRAKHVFVDKALLG